VQNEKDNLFPVDYWGGDWSPGDRMCQDGTNPGASSKAIANTSASADSNASTGTSAVTDTVTSEGTAQANKVAFPFSGHE
jgi:hypothetical protein